MRIEDYKRSLNPVREAYFYLTTAANIVELIEQGGRNIEDHPSLRKTAIGATKYALKVEIGDELTQDERIDFSNKLEKMLRTFPGLAE